MGPLKPTQYKPPPVPRADPVQFEGAKGPARTNLSNSEKVARRKMLMRRFAGSMSPHAQGLLMWVVMIVLGSALAMAAGGKPGYAEHVLHMTTGQLALYGALGGLVLGLPMYFAIARRSSARTPKTDQMDEFHSS